MFIEETKIGGRMALIAAVVIGLGFLAGCAPSQSGETGTYEPLLKYRTYENFFKTGKYRFFSPEKVIAAPELQGRPINPILPSLGPVDATDEIYPNAEYPGEQDYRYSDKDYVIGPLDTLGVGIMDLIQEGLEYQAQRLVTESGYIRLPMLDERIKAGGLTAQELEEAIGDAYKPEFLLDPTVTVMVIDRRQSMFSIVGAVSRTSTYNVIKPDMTLLDALAIAGGVTDPRIKYIYVVRQRPPELSGSQQVKEPAVSPADKPLPMLPSLPGSAEAVDEQAQPDLTPELVVPDLTPELVVPDLTPEPVPGLTPELVVPQESTTPQDKQQDDLRELEQMLENIDPLEPGADLDIESIPAEAEMAYITEMDGNSAGQSSGGQSAKPKWKYVNGRWIPEMISEPKPAPKPIVTPATAPAEPAPEPVIPEIEAEPIPSTLPEDVVVPVIAPEIVPEPVIPLTPADRQESVEVPSMPVVPADKGAAGAHRRDEPAETKQARPIEATPKDPFGWAELDKSSLTRIIAVNYEMLNQGNERMNIVVRDGDKIIVPHLKIGVYYVQGEISRPGVYGLTGRQITVKQALTEAGNMGPLAWPQNAMLIRRIGERQEQMIPLDIEAIFKGEENDFFLKADDVICIGTDVRSILYAVLRNAFRMTYGFGFIYDRNFSQPQFVTPTSNRFSRW